MIPEDAILMFNDHFGTETVAFSSWAIFRREWLRTCPEDKDWLDDLESQPQEKSEFYRAELQKAESEDRGIYQTERYISTSYNYRKKEFVRLLYRIYWDDKGEIGEVESLGEPEEEEE